MSFEQTEPTSWSSWEWRAIARENKSSIVVWPKSLFLSVAAISPSGKRADTLLNDSQQRCFSVALGVKFTKYWYRLLCQGLIPGKLLFPAHTIWRVITLHFLCCSVLSKVLVWQWTPMEEGCWLASFRDLSWYGQHSHLLDLGYVRYAWNTSSTIVCRWRSWSWETDHITDGKIQRLNSINGLFESLTLKLKHISQKESALATTTGVLLLKFGRYIIWKMIYFWFFG